jgi:hypothetical protein
MQLTVYYTNVLVYKEKHFYGLLFGNGGICTKNNLSAPPTGRLISIRRNGAKKYSFLIAECGRCTDENNDVRIEPKFYIPTCLPYDGGWCRPQTDGPALRAMAMAKYGMIKHEAGEDVSQIWEQLKFDMEWVVPNWESEG